MTEHPTLEPTDIVHLRAGEPSAAADTTATFTDLVCADHELLRAEFDAIITANFPDAADGTQRAARSARSCPGWAGGRRATLPPRQRTVHNGVAPPARSTHGPGSAGRPSPDWTAWPMTARATEQAEQGGS